MALQAIGLSWLLRILAWTWRVETIDPHNLASGVRSRPCVLAVFHGEQLPLLLTHRLPHIRLIASRSRDGEWLARTARALGFRSIRGSSSSGAVTVLRSALRELQAGRSVAIAVDGPRGPKGIPKPGAAYLARRGEVECVSVRAEAARSWRLSTWDEFLIPKPFSRISIRYDRGSCADASSAKTSHEP